MKIFGWNPLFWQRDYVDWRCAICGRALWLPKHWVEDEDPDCIRCGLCSRRVEKFFKHMSKRIDEIYGRNANAN